MNKISDCVKNSPIHFGISVLTTTISMIFVNLTIGAMGGIPLWISLMITFFVVRGIAITQPNQKLQYLFILYFLEYLLIWSVIKLSALIAQMLGWGNMKGVSITEYINRVYGSTLVERWAYVFAAVLMVSYIVSLFPLTILHEKKRWIGYFLADSLFFSAICQLVTFICTIWIPDSKETRIYNTMNALCICVMPHKWQAGAFLGCVFAFLILVMCVSYLIAGKIYKKEVRSENASKHSITKRSIILLFVAVLIIGIICYVLIVNQMKKNKPETKKYAKTAVYLTNDEWLGPIEYNGQLYIPIDMRLDYHEYRPVLGYLAGKDDADEDGNFELSDDNLLYSGTGRYEGCYLDLVGDNRAAFERVDLVEQNVHWKSNNLFVLWDEDWQEESSYSKERTGYSICENYLVRNLEEEFGQVEYRVCDFSDYDAYFTIRGYYEPREAFYEDVSCGEWVGCILVKDNKFYYGNYDNQITGNTLEELLGVLGGNDSSRVDIRETTTESE